MSTGAIVLLIVAAIVVIGLFMLVTRVLPAARARRRHERELDERRHEAIQAHIAAAEQRETRADRVEEQAEQIRLQAEMAERAASEEREAARMHKSRAELHEKGLMDHELGVETPESPAEPTPDRSLRSERDVVIGEDAPATGGRFAREGERTPAPEPGETRTNR